MPDTGIGFVPNGCELRQLVIQRPPRFPGEKRYVVSRDLWDRLDESNRAVLVLHEVILGDAIEDEHQTSESARYLNALITGNRLRGMAAKPYLDLLRQLGFSSGDYHNVSILLKSAKWNGDRLTEAATPLHAFIVQGNIHGTALCKPGAGALKFSPEGRLTKFSPTEGRRKEFFGECREHNLFYSAKTNDGEVTGNLEEFSDNLDGVERVRLRGGKTRISHSLLKISAARENVSADVTILTNDTIRDARVECLQTDTDTPCPSFGEAFYHDQWRKVSLVELVFGQIRDITLESPVKAKVGWQEVSFRSAQSTPGYFAYFLDVPAKYRFTNAEVLIHQIQVDFADQAKVLGVQLAQKLSFRDEGVKYVCEPGDFLDVRGRALRLSATGPCRQESPWDERR